PHYSAIHRLIISIFHLSHALLLSFTDPPPTELYTLSLHDALPIFADFAMLLEYVHEIPGIERIRYTTSHPKEMTSRLIDAHGTLDRKSTRLNSSHVKISYAVFCLKKKKTAKSPARRYTKSRLNATK